MYCNYCIVITFIHQVALARRQRRDLSVFKSCAVINFSYYLDQFYMFTNAIAIEYAKKFCCKFVSCFKQCGIITDMIPCCSYANDKDNHARHIGIK